MRRLLNDARGISLIEATIVLTVASILTAAAAPSVSRTLDRARLGRAVSDTQAIRAAIDTFVTEFTLFIPFTSSGANGGDTLEILVTDGDIPALSALINGFGAPHNQWDNVATCFGINGCPGGVDVGFLEAHLVANGGLGAAAATVYSTAAGGWRGAYINAPVDPDPWGNRYAVNVEYLRGTQTNDVFVLSAGPDEEIDTQYNFTGAAAAGKFITGGTRPGEDDITAVIRRDNVCVPTTPNCEVP